MSASTAAAKGPWSHDLNILKTQFHWTTCRLNPDSEIVSKRCYKLLMKLAKLYHWYGHDQGFVDDARRLHDKLQQIVGGDMSIPPPPFSKLD